jgi:hypothetical protein
VVKSPKRKKRKTCSPTKRTKIYCGENSRHKKSDDARLKLQLCPEGIKKTKEK